MITEAIIFEATKKYILDELKSYEFSLLSENMEFQKIRINTERQISSLVFQNRLIYQSIYPDIAVLMKDIDSLLSRLSIAFCQEHEHITLLYIANEIKNMKVKEV